MRSGTQPRQDQIHPHPRPYHPPLEPGLAGSQGLLCQLLIQLLAQLLAQKLVVSLRQQQSERPSNMEQIPVMGLIAS